MTPRALIFDMDDLLVRSSPIWRNAEETLLRALGRSWSPALARRYKGMNAPDVARVIHESGPAGRPLVECQRRLRDTLLAGFQQTIQPMPGAVKLVRRLAGRIPMAVASGSPLAAIERAMVSLEIRPLFARLITSEDVARGKPHPDVFLAAAEATGVPANECLVFEDSLIGVRAARAAGMACFAVPSGNAAAIRHLATRTFSSLTKVQLADVFGG